MIDRAHQRKGYGRAALLTNLLSNAIKFSPRGEVESMNGVHAGGLVTFRVTDHGRGVPEDMLESIFERFEQVDASDFRDKGGSGLTAGSGRSETARAEACFSSRSRWRP